MKQLFLWSLTLVCLAGCSTFKKSNTSARQSFGGNFGQMTGIQNKNSAFSSPKSICADTFVAPAAIATANAQITNKKTRKHSAGITRQLANEKIAPLLRHRILGLEPCPQTETNSLIAFIFAMVGAVFLPLIMHIPALILGINGLNEVKAHPEKYSPASAGLAKAAIIVSIVYIGLTLLLIMALIVSEILFF